jgi:alpha-L-fucosidase 2
VLASLGSSHLSAATVPPDVLAQLNGYNEVWTSPSTNSAGSMPLGNGDITANVWVEKGGDLLMYIGKSDCWSEGTRLLKLGRTRIHFSPNPFAAGMPFSQTLNFYQGEIGIAAGPIGSQVNVRIWIDANSPVIRVEAGGDQAFVMTCSNEVWRSSRYTLPSASDSLADSFRGVVAGTTNGFPPSESADVVLSLFDRLVWYHRNTNSLFQTILNWENLAGFQANHPDPYLNLTFGATMKGSGLSKINDYALQSSSTTNVSLSICCYTAQTGTAAEWQEQMSNVVAQVDATGLELARTNHDAWWDAFWNRSWIFVSGDASATNVTRGYLEQRFMEACQGRGKYPMKFNGGTFTFDYSGRNGDYRKWGPAYWHQNTRHLYWPLPASGDFDLMLPFFNCYTNLLNLQADVVNKYYGHAGVFFPETFNFYGLFTPDNWGWNRTNATDPSNGYIKYHYQGGLETLALMLDYNDYTRDDAFATNYIVPMATQVIRFFDRHWTRVNGQIKFYPANALETYWSCTNSTDYLAGLLTDIPRLLALSTNLTTAALRTEWSNCLDALPPLPLDAGGAYVKPAATYGSRHNSENPECYCIFPYRIYGIGKPDLNIGLATFANRAVQNNKNCWSQDLIQEALLGLTNDAKADVISNFTQKDSQCRFFAFWSSHHDYLPDLDNGGAAMTALQFMVLQCNGSEIRVLPAWPANWNVDFKLRAPDNTFVRLKFQGGTVTRLDTSPMSRRNDVVTGYSLPAPTAPPRLGRISLSGEDIVLEATNGVPGADCYVLTSTNMALPLSNWTALETNIFDADGNLTFTNAVHFNASQFYLLQAP